MGANIYLEDVKSFGYSNAAGTATVTANIPGQSGTRIAVRAFGFTCGNVATSLFFMQTLATTTIKGAVASNLTTVVLASVAIGGTVTGAVGNLAAGDFIVIKLDDNTQQFQQVVSVAGSVVEVTAALADTVASGNTVWGLGVRSDNGHLGYKLTASTQSTVAIDGGVFYANAKQYPMIAFYLNATATTAGTPGSFDYLTIDYLNV